MFTDEQVKQLREPLNQAHVKKRQNLSYIEGWHSIAEANRIFGEGNWSRETLTLTKVEEGERGKKNTPFVAYIAKVRVTVYPASDWNESGRVAVREGTGYGSGYGADMHEGAVKEAETDAMKRALMTFGNPFGLALYDKTQANVESPQERKQRKAKEKYGLTAAQRKRLADAREGKADKVAEIKAVYETHGLLGEDPVDDEVVDKAVEEIEAL